MLIHVSGRGFELGGSLREEICERVAHALGRFDSRIDRVKIYLEDENGPKNGRDKSLRILIHMKRSPAIVLEEKGEAWHSMIDHSSERAVQTVSRLVKRLRSRTGRTSMSGDDAVAKDAHLQI